VSGVKCLVSSEKLGRDGGIAVQRLITGLCATHDAPMPHATLPDRQELLSLRGDRFGCATYHCQYNVRGFAAEAEGV
jgi:hypothetical protein